MSTKIACDFGMNKSQNPEIRVISDCKNNYRLISIYLIVTMRYITIIYQNYPQNKCSQQGQRDFSLWPVFDIAILT